MLRFPANKRQVLKILFLVVAAAALALPAFSQQVDTAWVRRYKGPGLTGNNKTAAIAVDSVGNVYVAGNSFDSTSRYDYATIKYRPNGDTAWMRRYNGPANDTDLARAMVLDASCNIYVTGVSHGSITTLKYDSSGNLLWVDSLPTNVNFFRLSISGGYALGLDRQGNIYVTGQQWDLESLSWFVVKYDPLGNRLWLRTPWTGERSTFGLAVDSSGDVVAFAQNQIVRYDPNGNQRWLQTYPPFFATAVVLGGAGSVYVTGTGQGTGYGSYQTVKYDSMGNQLWAREYNSAPREFDFGKAYAIAADKNGGVYVTGQTSYSGETFYPIVVKYDSSGNQLWNTGALFPGVGFAIALDDTGNIYVTGYQATAKYDSIGSLIWHKGDNFLYMNALALDGHKNVYVTGYDFSTTGKNLTTIKYSPLPQLKDDLNLDGALSTADVVLALNCTFLGEAPPAAPIACDINCDGKVTPADVVILLNMVFLSASAPC